MKVAAWLGLLQERGPGLARPYAGVLEEPVRELRVSFGRLDIRLLYGRDTIVVTHGFLKKTRKVSREEICQAMRYRRDWLARFG